MPQKDDEVRRASSETIVSLVTALLGLVVFVAYVVYFVNCLDSEGWSL
jgi:hypothetical protein